VGVSDGQEELEGSVGDVEEVASNVAAIVSFYGASNLETILDQSTPHGLSVRIPALQLLLRAHPSKDPAIAKLASPVAHVDGDDPPLFLLHGDQDPQMPINQSHELQGAYDRAKGEALFEVVHGAAHGGKVFYEPERLKRVASFIRESLSR
ncbi:MAG: prolyl oligopeptidase family serine peptidase, partial [Rubripirellula sp.]